jgi:hypothetical protein
MRVSALSRLEEIRSARRSRSNAQPACPRIAADDAQVPSFATTPAQPPTRPQATRPGPRLALQNQVGPAIAQQFATGVFAHRGR